MTRKETQNLLHGVYRLYWRSGGCSLASVGSLHNGDRWFACANWTSEKTRGIVVANDWWRKVVRAELVERQVY
jgi:hypothetical protein